MPAPLRTVGDILDDMDAGKAAGIGHNNPPEATPYAAAQAAVAEVRLEAGHWLDGQPVASQDQADWLDALLDRARAAKSLADDNRKVEAKPFDDGKADVQARYKPLIDDADLIARTIKAALTGWREAQEAAREAAAALAAQEAERLAEIARKARGAVQPGNLSDADEAERLTQAAAAAARAAKPKAAPTGLVTRWTATVNDRRAALNHYAARDPDGLLAWVQAHADADARGTRPPVPGVAYASVREAR